MASRKITFFFKDADGFGWSETYFNAQSTDAAVSGAAAGLAVARMGMATTNVLLTHIRIQTATKRLSITNAPNNGQGLPGQQPTPTDAPEVGLKVKLQAGSTGFNRKLLRGLPDRVIQDNSFFTDPSFTAAFNAYRNVLLTNQFNAVGRLGTAGPTEPINTVHPNPPRGFGFNAGATFANIGDTIRVFGVNLVGYNGIKIVTQKFAATSGSNYFVGGVAPPVAGSDGSAVKLGSYDAPLSNVTIDGVTRRGAGVPFGLSRGRKRTVYSLRQ